MSTVLARGAVLVIVVAFGVTLGATPGSSLSASSYYLGRGDPRACPSPVCGGVWLHAVNTTSRRCGDGVARNECYAATIDLARLPLSEEARTKLAGLVSAGRALARGTLVTGRIEGFPQLATLVASEVWPASSSR